MDIGRWLLSSVLFPPRRLQIVVRPEGFWWDYVHGFRTERGRRTMLWPQLLSWRPEDLQRDRSWRRWQEPDGYPFETTEPDPPPVRAGIGDRTLMFNSLEEARRYAGDSDDSDDEDPWLHRLIAIYPLPKPEVCPDAPAPGSSRGFDAAAAGITTWWPQGHPRPFTTHVRRIGRGMNEMPQPWAMGWDVAIDEANDNNEFMPVHLNYRPVRGPEAADGSDMWSATATDHQNMVGVWAYANLMSWNALLQGGDALGDDYWYVMRRWSGPQKPPPSLAARAVTAWRALFETCGGRSSEHDEAPGRQLGSAPATEEMRR